MPKTLSDPEEYARIKRIYFEPEFVTDLTNEELMDQQAQRERLSVNHAR